MTYLNFLDVLRKNAEEEFAAFQQKLIFTERKILGVRTPVMRKIAKNWKSNIDELFSFPNEYYETVFIKLAVVSLLPYEQFLRYVELCVSLMDNWALCDCFKVKCIAKRKEDFLPVIDKFFQTGKEYYVRYALVSLLNNYVEKSYIPRIKEYLQKIDENIYYIHMAAAWLTAEVLIKEYDEGIKFLEERILPIKTHNKAIQKAVESYRITQTQKEYLRSLKIKN